VLELLELGLEVLGLFGLLGLVELLELPGLPGPPGVPGLMVPLWLEGALDWVSEGLLLGFGVV
jgi:hypothetical protein